MVPISVQLYILNEHIEKVYKSDMKTRSSGICIVLYFMG